MMEEKKVLVIGLGLSGRAAAQFLLTRGFAVWGADRSREVLSNHPQIEILKDMGLRTFHEEDPFEMEAIDLVVVSPGVPPSNPLYQRAKQLGIELISEVELACRHFENPMIGISGTNGKTTTTLFLTHLLNYHGRPARALGNVGVPLISEVLEDQRSEIIVAELSSFQIDLFDYPCLEAGMILNISPDHLDRYKTLESYAQAKINLQRCLKPGAPMIMSEEVVQRYGDHFQCPLMTFGYNPSCTVWSDTESLYDSNEIVAMLPASLKGRRSHQLENLMAAYLLAARLMGITAEETIKSWETFKAPPHRLQYVRQVEGITFYDDSKATNVGSVQRALESLQGPILLLAGGRDKESNFRVWKEVLEGKVKGIFAFGEAKEKLKAELSEYCPVATYEDLDKAFQAACQQAQEGDSVLLSPGCASFDQFQDYAHRGQTFQKLVNQLCLSGAKT